MQSRTHYSNFVMSVSPNREKVLLNLKWFSHRLVKVFNAKLSKNISHSSNNDVFSVNDSTNDSDELLQKIVSNSDTPLLRRLLVDQLKLFDEKKTKCKTHSQSDISVKLGRSFDDRSPLMRIRSLTNSPLFRRLSISGYQSNRKKTLCPITQNRIHSADGESESLNIDGIPACDARFSNSSIDKHCSRLNIFIRDSTDAERRKDLFEFAQQLCIIYEYQLGMLRGLTAIHAAADYVSEIILKAINMGKLSSLSPEDLNPCILFDNSLRISMRTKTVKTCPLPITGEQLTWRLGDMWTLPGLRHNEVGGENCHNLSIVTHFLSSTTLAGENSKSDIYGYRNIILTRNTNSEKELKSQIFTENSENIKCLPLHFDTAPMDSDTITWSKVQTRKPNDDSSSNGSLSPTKIREKPQQFQAKQNVPPPLHMTRRSTNLSSSSTIRQHLHRAYRPVFFVIFNKPGVVEHLTECDSFAAFCKRQALSPVMFLNQPTTIFDEKPYPCIYNNFDIFTVSVSGYNSQAGAETHVPFADVKETQILPFVRQDTIDQNKSPVSVASYANGTRNLPAYDNLGFAC